jgi:hypothetical protein
VSLKKELYRIKESKDFEGRLEERKDEVSAPPLPSFE